MSLTNTQYYAIMRQYEARQTKNQHIAQQRLQRAYQDIPGLKEINDAISSVSVERAKMLLDGDGSALTALKKELSELIGEKEALLRDMGYPGDYFIPPYQCPDCKDTGYTDGKKCHCFLQASIDLQYTQSNIRRILEEENFGTFSLAYYSPDDINKATGISSLAAAEEAVKNCKAFIRDFDTSFVNLFFYGDTGVGKTFLSNCVAKELLDSAHSVIYFTASQLMKIFEKNTFGREESAKGDYQNLFECDLLIIDDLGAELSNSFTASQLFLCLNERILRQRSTIISTNLSIQQLVDTYSERTFSRISSYYTMIKLFGADIRILKKLKGPYSSFR